MKQIDQIELFTKILDGLGRAFSSGRSVPELAKAAGVSSSTIYNWLNGKVSSPHLRTAIGVAKALGYDIHLVKRKLRKAA